MEQTEYLHEPLSRTEIRLLKLLPNQIPGQPIKCEITNIQLQSSAIPTYTAVSYCWGSPMLTHSIQIAGDFLPVPSSVHEVLHALSVSNAKISNQANLQSQRIWIWIDAVCINQNDRREKSSQIQLMGDVYSKAEEVFVWLGDEKDGSTEAMIFLGNVEKTLEGLVTGNFRSQAAMERLGVVASSEIVRPTYFFFSALTKDAEIMFGFRLPVQLLLSYYFSCLR